MAVLRLMTSSNLVGALHRQVGRLLALEDAIDVAGRASVLVDQIGAVGDQAATGDVEAEGVDRGQAVPDRKRRDQIAMTDRQRARQHDQTAIQLPREPRDGALDLPCVAHVDRPQLHSKRRRHGLDRAQPLAGGWGAWAQAGGLVSYRPNISEMVRQSALYVDKS